MRTLWYYIKNLYFKMDRDNVLFLASGVAFNLLISAIPLMLIIFSIGGFILYTSSELWDKLVLFIQNLIPVSSERIINNAQAIIQDRAWIGVVGIVGIAFTATRLFATLRTVLDVVFEADKTRGMIHGKLFDFTMLLLLGLVLVLTNLVLTFLPGITRLEYLDSDSLFLIESLLQSELFVIAGSFAITVVLLFFSYKLFPTEKVRSDTCWVASLLAAVIIELTKHGYRYYISLYPEINRVYGTLGAIVAMIVWFYIVALVYVVAAELAFIRQKRRHPG